MVTVNPAARHGTTSPTEGFLDHFVISTPENLLARSPESQRTTNDPSVTSSALSGAGSRPTAPTSLAVEDEKTNGDGPLVAANRTSSTRPESGSCKENEFLSTLAKWRKWALFACSCLLQFLLQLDMAAVAVTLPVRWLPQLPRCPHQAESLIRLM